MHGHVRCLCSPNDASLRCFSYMLHKLWPSTSRIPTLEPICSKRPYGDDISRKLAISLLWFASVLPVRLRLVSCVSHWYSDTLFTHWLSLTSVRRDMRPIVETWMGILSVAVRFPYPQLISSFLSRLSLTAFGRQRIQNHKLPARVGWGKPLYFVHDVHELSRLCSLKKC